MTYINRRCVGEEIRWEEAIRVTTRRLRAGYWLFTAAVLFTVVILAHFVGAQREEPIRDIYGVYDNPIWSLLWSLLALAGTACSVAMLISTLVGDVPINNRVLELSPRRIPKSFCICERARIGAARKSKVSGTS